MKLTFNNINPCKLQDALIECGITPLLTQSDLEENKHIATNVWVTLTDDVAVAKVDEIANNVILNQNRSTTTATEPTISDLQTQIFNLTSQLVNGGAL